MNVKSEKTTIINNIPAAPIPIEGIDAFTVWLVMPILIGFIIFA